MIRELFVDSPRYTGPELMDRLKFFVGIILALTLFGIVFVVLYSLIFVTQPLDAISPIDNKFFELIIPIATFLTGTLSGIMLAGDNKEAQMKALEAANRPYTPPPSPPPAVSSTPSSVSISSPAPTPVEPVVAQVITGFGGKPAPAQPPHPEI
jgi:hypothetical protein